MTKRTAHALALVLFAMPLLIVGCGDSDNKGGTGGTMGGTGGTTRYDGGGGAGGAKLDVGGAADVTPPAIDTPPVADVPVALDAPVIDVAVAVDTTPVVVLDAAIPDAPIAPDAPIQIDTAATDSTKPIDSAALDTAVAVDSTPVVACTTTTPFTGGDVTANLTLTKACSPYLIGTGINVGSNAILTIEAGVTLKFDPDQYLTIGSSGAGKLVANGTATSPIIFTSSNITPGAGDWLGIQLWAGTMTGTSISYATLDYCGQANGACIFGEVGVQPNRVAIDHVTIAHVGAKANGIQEDDEASNFSISNSTFSNISATPNQQYAISVQAPSFAGIDSTNTFNGGAMIQLDGGTVAVSTNWKDPGTHVAVTHELSLGGTTSPILTIAAGSYFMFASDITFTVGYSDAGNLKVNGTSASHVTFTSLDASPAAGSWAGIGVWWNGEATLSYADISYGGSTKASSSLGGNVSLLDTGAKLTIQNSILSNSSLWGIFIPCGSTSTITSTNNTFTSDPSGNVGPGPGPNTACP